MVWPCVVRALLRADATRLPVARVPRVADGLRAAMAMIRGGASSRPQFMVCNALAIGTCACAIWCCQRRTLCLVLSACCEEGCAHLACKRPASLVCSLHVAMHAYKLHTRLLPLAVLAMRLPSCPDAFAMPCLRRADVRQDTTAPGSASRLQCMARGLGVLVWPVVMCALLLPLRAVPVASGVCRVLLKASKRAEQPHGSGRFRPCCVAWRVACARWRGPWCVRCCCCCGLIQRGCQWHVCCVLLVACSPARRSCVRALQAACNAMANVACGQS